MSPFDILLVAHALADMILGQTEYEALNKAHKWWPCLRHAGKWTIVLAAASYLAGWRFQVAYALLLVLMGAAHAIIDRRWPIVWILRRVKGSINPQPWLVMWVDQVVHIVQCSILACGLAALS